MGGALYARPRPAQPAWPVEKKTLTKTNKQHHPHFPPMTSPTHPHITIIDPTLQADTLATHYETITP